MVDVRWSVCGSLSEQLRRARFGRRATSGVKWRRPSGWARAFVARRVVSLSAGCVQFACILRATGAQFATTSGRHSAPPRDWVALVCVIARTAASSLAAILTCRKVRWLQ